MKANFSVELIDVEPEDLNMKEISDVLVKIRALGSENVKSSTYVKINSSLWTEDGLDHELNRLFGN